MSRARFPRAWLLLGAALLMLAPLSLAVGEVTRTEGGAPPAATTEPPRPVHGPEPLRVECWQEGVRILEERGLSGLSIAAATRESSVSFKRQGDGNASVFLLPVADGVCLIQPEG
ncbi:MAG: hypothetical protein ACREH3_06650 [Geminicoccales bacterium]